MPPRHTYWTIILEGKPTAFRAHTEDELLPTLKQLQMRHPDAVLRWFARGRLWHSQEEERLARAALGAKRENRGRDWRPGGAHQDPRERFKIPRDEKRRRFRDRLFRDRPGPERRGGPEGEKPRDQDRPPDQERARPAPRGPRPEAKRPWKPARPREDRSRSGETPARSGPADRKPGWKPPRPSGQGEGQKGWDPNRPRRPAGGSPGWKPSGPAGQGQGDRGSRGWKPGRPAGQGGGSNRGWNRGGPSSGARGPGRKPGGPGGGGRRGGGGGGSSR